MRVMLLGINHRTAPVEMRERLAFNSDGVESALTTLRTRFASGEFVLISTCNRTEIYVARPVHAEPTADALRLWLAEHTNVPADQLLGCTIQRDNLEAVKHLFRVTAGLDSMVVGETQILGQTRRSYEAATQAGSVGPVLHQVFQDALKVGKTVRTESGIDRGRVSIGSVAADFARQIFERFDDKTVLSIGAGEITKVTLEHLRGLSPKAIVLVNRTLANAQQLADSLDLNGSGPGSQAGGARAWEDLDQLLIEADIVITSTAATEPILTVDRIKPALKKRRYRPLFLLDLAMPRDVDPAVGSLRNVYLYNIDELQQETAANHEKRSEIAASCEARIADAAQLTLGRLQHRDVGHLIRALRAKMHDVGTLELERTKRKLDATEAEHLQALVEEHTHRVINKILHMPLSELQKDGANGKLGFYAAALRGLFAIEDETPSSSRPMDDDSADAVSDEVNANASPDDTHDDAIKAASRTPSD